MYVFGYIIYWQLNKKLNCLLFSLILFLLVQGNCVHKTRLGDQCSQLLASIKIQCLNLNFFLEVSTMPHKSFIALSSGLGVRGIEVAIDIRWRILFYVVGIKELQ